MQPLYDVVLLCSALQLKLFVSTECRNVSKVSLLKSSNNTRGGNASGLFMSSHAEYCYLGSIPVPGEFVSSKQITYYIKFINMQKW